MPVMIQKWNLQSLPELDGISPVEMIWQTLQFNGEKINIYLRKVVNFKYFNLGKKQKVQNKPQDFPDKFYGISLQHS